MKNHKFAFLIHTHTDCLDAFEITMGQLAKYFPKYKKYVMINKDIDSLKQSENTTEFIIYNENDLYTKRFRATLEKITENKIMFLHEDMILYDTPNYEELNRVCEFMDKNAVDFIKLIASLGIEEAEVDRALRIQQGYTFAVQPSIWNVNSLKSLMNEFTANIWNLELSCQEFCRSKLKSYTYFRGDEKKRGQAHFDSHIFPYTATAIIKGKWNYLEYSKELSSLLNEYKVGFDRQIVT